MEKDLHENDEIRIMNSDNEQLKNQTFIVDRVEEGEVSLIDVHSHERVQLPVQEDGTLGDDVVYKLLRRGDTPAARTRAADIRMDASPLPLPATPESMSLDSEFEHASSSSKHSTAAASSPLTKNEEDKSNISWHIIDRYFHDNPNNLVAHHIDSVNDFYRDGIHRIFRENNPFRFIEREDTSVPKDQRKLRNECLLYLGGKDGKRIYYGKPVIYDENHTHYMYPNDARLRNMTYGFTIHYDVDVEFIYYENEVVRKTSKKTLEKVYLGRFPIMLQSDLCILKGLHKEVRFNAGECRNDYGGYFIIDGNEKVIIPQEKFADNILYIRAYKEDKSNFSHSADIRSVSQDSSKPIRTTSVRIVAPSESYTNNQIVVSVPNVKQPVPLFILMRALGVISDRDIIRTCLLDLDQHQYMVDLFIPSVHDANKVFTQQVALEFIAELTKRGTVSSVMEILSDYLLPHIGELNLLEKAYYIGYMVHRLLRVYTKEDPPTDRDNFRYKRIELAGDLMYDLFREYYLLQKKHIEQAIDKMYYFNEKTYTNDGGMDGTENRFLNLVDENNKMVYFKEKKVEEGFRKAFKGNWGAEPHTKRQGVVQQLDRLSWYSFMSHLRKINLPIDTGTKVGPGPRLLNSSQWGFIDPIDTPDGGNIGLHKHLAITTYITNYSSGDNIVQWIRQNAKKHLRLILECVPEEMARSSKVFVNGVWVGLTNTPFELVDVLKLHRRNGILPVYASFSFDIEHNEVNIYTDAGRLTRPIYYIQKGKVSYERGNVSKGLERGQIKWEELVAGFLEKSDIHFKSKANRIYDTNTLYPSVEEDKIEESLRKHQSVLDYVDTVEEEAALIATNTDDLRKSKYYTHLEIDPSLILGVMGNLIIYPEHNPLPRNSFSCGQSKQAVSVYHSNYQMRMDKMGVLLNYGQIPLVKSRYLDYINSEQQPYGVNAIVAIMCYTGYNVEDAILVNEGSILRGMFRTSYYSMYEAEERTSKVAGEVNSKFANIERTNVVGKKKGYDYTYLDSQGMIREGTEVHDKMVLIGKVNYSKNNKDLFVDDSVKPKKGQVGFVDKSFITHGEEGYNIAKVRLREDRIPAIGDKMASRSGQKGTIGLIIPEESMPFLEDGLRPDIIINPHALPSRMTIGQIVESMFGIACASYGGFGDCTAFQVKGANYDVYGPMLTKAGFNHTGNHLLYNGMTGEQMQANIYMGPTYYMRLKHMVKDKINYRARGPNQQLTRQAVQGRANDGGLRIGEMERDAVCAHGLAYFLNESFMERGDEYYMAVCNKTGSISIYNPEKNLFLSPAADGPIRFHTTPDGEHNVMTLSKYGRSFSLLRIPYSFKLLMQELQCMNINMRLVTDANVDQLMSMSFSNNITRLLKQPIAKHTDELKEVVSEYARKITENIEYVRPDKRKRQQQRAFNEDTVLKKPEEPSSIELDATTSTSTSTSTSTEDEPLRPATPPFDEVPLIHRPVSAPPSPEQEAVNAPTPQPSAAAAEEVGPSSEPVSLLVTRIPSESSSSILEPPTENPSKEGEQEGEKKEETDSQPQTKVIKLSNENSESK